MTTRIYGPISPSQIDQFLQEATNNHLTVTKTDNYAGEVSGMGIRLAFIFDASTQRIALNLIGYPPFSEHIVWRKLEDQLPATIVRILS
jgi:hypothetical protein